MKVDEDSSTSVSSSILPPPPVNPLLTINPPTSSLSRPSHRVHVPVSQSSVLSPSSSSSSPINHYTPPTPQLSAATTTVSIIMCVYFNLFPVHSNLSLLVWIREEEEE